jgi:hypothetical protein
MFERLRELGTHVVVAPVAHLRLPLGKKIAARFRLMDRMACGADDIRLGVITLPNVCSRGIFGVTAQTRLQNLSGRYFRICDDRLLPAFSVNVFLSWAVTAFATDIFWSARLGDVRFIVWVAEELEGDVGMACAASIAADIT